MTAPTPEQEAAMQKYRDAMDYAVRRGFFDSACAAAKLYSAVQGYDGRRALEALVQSVERVVGR